MKFPSYKSDPSRCEICGKPSNVHVSHTNGKSQNHFCHEHAETAGIPDNPPRFQEAVLSLGVSDTANDWMVNHLLDGIRRMVGFIRKYGRRPTGREFRELAFVPIGLLDTKITDPELRKELSQLDGVLKFLETHRRMPESEDERKSVGLD